MPQPRVIVTGATGFLGRHLVDALHGDYELYALSRGSPALRGITFPAGVRWLGVDVARQSDVDEAFAEIEHGGGAEIVVHLAGYYDFTGERVPEYERTNVHGTRNVLEASRRIGVRDVVFASSVAACGFPPSREMLTEDSPPDGDTPYAESKRAGERLLVEYRESIRGFIVRFAALHSDWCEYEPLFRFMELWLSRHPRSRLLAGRGLSAVPYLHVRDAVTFLRALLSRRHDTDPDRVLLASPSGATSHLELFEAVTAAHFGERARPVFIPRGVCRPALHLRHWAGTLVGVPAFERPWMGRIIDLRLEVDGLRTRDRLGWAPRPRLGIVRRVPFLVQNRKAFPSEWQRRNHAAMKSVRRHENLHVHRSLRLKARAIVEAWVSYLLDPTRAALFPAVQRTRKDHQRMACEWLLESLLEAVRTGEKAVFQRACRRFAERMQRDGVSADEITSSVHALGDLCVLAMQTEQADASWSLALYDHITMTVQFGVDETYDLFEETSSGAG